MNYLKLASILAPSIALLILSTTIRLGNVRVAIMDLAKISGTVASGQSETFFINRATYLSSALQYLTLSFMLFVVSLIISFAVENKIIYSNYLLGIFAAIFFTLLLHALFQLYQESRLACHSIHTLTDAMKREKNNTTKNN